MKVLISLLFLALIAWAGAGCTRNVVEQREPRAEREPRIERERVIERDRPVIVEHRDYIERR